MTAPTKKSLKPIVLAVLALALMPATLTMLDASPMGYHAGMDLTLRVAATTVAGLLLGAVIAYATALYWVNVVQPAPAPVRRRHH